MVNSRDEEERSFEIEVERKRRTDWANGDEKSKKRTWEVRDEGEGDSSDEEAKA